MSINRLIKKLKPYRFRLNKATDHHLLDQQVVFRLAKSRLPGWRQWRYLPKFLSRKEKIIVIVCLLSLITSLTIIANHYYRRYRLITPRNGGYYVEGLIGAPRYINPIYSAINQTDRDLTRLIYSSLFTRDSHGQITEDLADSYEISPDRLIYTIRLRNELKWSDGQNLTADDVLFTYGSIIDSAYGSPLQSSLVGLDITKVDDLTIKFTLSQPYNSFLDLLTIGILPNHLWGQIPAESASLADLNLKPIGSGPYKFKSLNKDRSGNIKSYQLTLNPNYHKQKPYIPEITFKFYTGYEELVAALNDGSIDGAAYLPQKIAEKLITTSRYNLKYLNTTQLIAVFINEDDQTLKNKMIRQAMAKAIDKNQILLDNNNLIGHLANGPILKHHPYYNTSLVRPTFNLDEAKKILADDGWQPKTITTEEVTKAQEQLDSDQGDQNENKVIVDMGAGQWLQKNNQFLGLNLTTTREPDYLNMANQIAQAWQKLGIKINLDIVDAENINSQIIRRKNYSLLLYGQNLGPENDLTALWHSAQSGPNGLNLSNYRNSQVDKNLETIRTATELSSRQQAAHELQKQINDDLPAIFLYNPTYLYTQNKKIKGLTTELMIEPADRFNQINQWYIKTKISWQYKNK